MKQLVAILMLGVMGACANYASFQEADTLPVGTSRVGVGVTGTTYEIRINEDVEEVTLPAVNFWWRRGLTEPLEAHAAVWIPFGASAGFKYQVTGNRQQAGLSFSLGLDVGYLRITAESDSGNGSGEGSSVSLLDTYIPLYIGFRTGPGFAVYGSPKLVLRTAVGGDNDTTLTQLAGGTAGIAVGANTTFHLEGTLMYDFDVEAPAAQVGIGIAF